MKKLNWAIVGLGTIAHEFTQQFKGDCSQIYAACSRTLEKATNFCQQYHIPKAYDSYQKLLMDDTIDVVYIATPHQFHFEEIKQALQHGKHVFCEKAITLNIQELLEVSQLAEKNHLILAEGTTLFYMPIYKKLKRLQNEGYFGKLKMVQATFGSFKDPNPENRFFNPKLAGGALLDIGPYAFGICHLFFNGRVNKIETSMEPFFTGVDESSATILHTDQKELATISMTFRAKMPKRTIVAFDKGYLTLEDYPRTNRATFTTPEGKVTIFEEGKTDQTFYYEIKSMEEMILHHQPNEVIKLSLDVMQSMSICQEKWKNQ